MFMNEDVALAATIGTASFFHWGREEGGGVCCKLSSRVCSVEDQKYLYNY